MKKFLTIIFLTLVFTKSSLSQELKLSCTVKESSIETGIFNTGDVHSVIISSRGAMIGLNNGLTQFGELKDKFDGYDISGSFINSQHKKSGAYQMQISRVTGEFRLFIIFAGSKATVEQFGICKAPKFKF
tara:strand:- start:121 stop:510 length:390 start_codon:yes stop_codon:yes gene_type:complete